MVKLDANVILLIAIELNIGAYLFVDVVRDSLVIKYSYNKSCRRRCSEYAFNNRYACWEN